MLTCGSRQDQGKSEIALGAIPAAGGQCICTIRIACGTAGASGCDAATGYFQLSKAYEKVLHSLAHALALMVRICDPVNEARAAWEFSICRYAGGNQNICSPLPISV